MVTVDRLHAGRVSTGKCDGLATMFQALRTALTTELQLLLPSSSVYPAAPPPSGPGSAEPPQVVANKAALTDALASFQFIANAVWPELASALVEVRDSGIPEAFSMNPHTPNLQTLTPPLPQVAHAIFAPGIPESFHRNFSLYASFLERVEEMCQSTVEVSEP